MRTSMLCIGLFGFLASAWTQGTAFTYQGLLKQSGTPVNANHDFQFSLWTTASGATQVGSTLTLMNVLVQNGLFTVSLDFGAVWDGSDRFIQIAVRPAGVGSYTTLSPRVKINPTPYAIRANTAGTANPIGAAGGDLSGSYPNPTVARLQGRAVSATVPGDGQVLKWNAATNAWLPAADLRDAFWQASGSDIFYTAGNVGIRTNLPNSPLTIQGSGGNSEWLQFRNSAGTNKWHFNNLNGGLNIAESGGSPHDEPKVNAETLPLAKWGSVRHTARSPLRVWAVNLREHSRLPVAGVGLLAVSAESHAVARFAPLV